MPGSFSEVGCRRCGEGGYAWKIYTDGEGNFEAHHRCGHVSTFTVVPKKDPQAFDMRVVL